MRLYSTTVKIVWPKPGVEEMKIDCYSEGEGPPPQKSGRGFASMDSEKQRTIARKDGESVPPEKRSFSQNNELARAAGRKGGQSVNPNNRTFSRNHTLASEAGRKGGSANKGKSRTSKIDKK